MPLAYDYIIVLITGENIAKILPSSYKMVVPQSSCTQESMRACLNTFLVYEMCSLHSYEENKGLGFNTIYMSKLGRFSVGYFLKGTDGGSIKIHHNCIPRVHRIHSYS